MGDGAKPDKVAAKTVKAGAPAHTPMDILRPEVSAYMRNLQRSTDPVLEAMEARAQRDGFPIIGPLVGRACGVLAKAIAAKTVFEMGSGFGYSTLHFAKALGPGSVIYHTDGDPARTAEAKAYLAEAGVANRVRFHTGDALAAMAAHPGVVDVVFIDVDKEQYPDAWRVACAKVRVGGWILTDNTLWSGKVAGPGPYDEATAGVRAYNEAAFRDARFVTTIIPIRDGLAASLRVA